MRHHLFDFIIGSSLFVSLTMSLVGLAIERACPAERDQPSRNITLNLCYSIIQGSIAYALTPLASGLAIIAVNALGGGLFLLPSVGWGIVWAIPLYLLTVDLSEYLFHRAQHTSRFLWSMHSLHHSDQSLNITTTTRHFWIESGLKALFVYPLVGLLFRPSTIVITAYTVATYWNFVVHMNVRLSFGRFWFLLNSPHYHRIHHGASQVYANRNFVGLFPIYDILLGTQYRPKKGEYPATGLDGGDAPRSIFEAVLWPVNRYLQFGRVPSRQARLPTNL